MSDTLLIISEKGLGVVGITDDNGYLAGIITDGDLRRHMDGLLNKTAGDVMTKSPTIIGPAALAEEAVAVMNDRQITCLFVVDETTVPVGVLKIQDCMRAGVV